METKRFCFFCDNRFLGLGFSTLTATLLSLLTQTHRHPRTHTPTLTHARNGTGPIKARGPPKHAFGPSKGSSHGTVTARSRHGHGTRVTALSRHCHGTLSRHCHGTVTAHHFLKNPMCFSTIRKMTWRGARRTPCAHATTRRWGARSTPRLHATTGPEGARSTPSVQGDGKDPKKARGPSRIDSS